MKKKDFQNNSLLRNLGKILLNSKRNFFKKISFWLHESLITLLYGYADFYHEFNISKKLIFKIERWVEINRNKELILDEIEGLLLNETKKGEEQKSIDRYLIRLNSFPNYLLKELSHELRSILNESLKSPFCIVNTRAWITLPNEEKFGPTKFHKDGFYSGHLKAMIYLTPANEEYGSIQIGEKKIISDQKGLGILFHNSDVRHKGIAGKSKERISIEITFLRTLKNIDQDHKGHPNGRHYKNVLFPYFKKSH